LNIQTFKRILWLALCVLSLGVGARAQDAPDQVEPDRPDVTNGTRIVTTGLIQVEFGGLYVRQTSAQRSAGSPFTVRVGLADWIEARIGADGLTSLSGTDTNAAGFGNVQLGAKLRLWDKPGGAPVLSILPDVNLPTADSTNGLGSGDFDYTLAFLTGTDIGRRGHIDLNYGIGAIGAGSGLPHFVQHLVSASLSAAVTDRWNPYVELFWFSRTDPEGTAETSIDAGVIYELGSHFAIDGGVQTGVGGSAPHFAAFGGLSIVLGADRALNGRRRKVPAPAPKPRR
jgi:hypothetical protein